MSTPEDRDVPAVRRDRTPLWLALAVALAAGLVGLASPSSADLGPTPLEAGGLAGVHVLPGPVARPGEVDGSAPRRVRPPAVAGDDGVFVLDRLERGEHVSFLLQLQNTSGAPLRVTDVAPPLGPGGGAALVAAHEVHVDPGMGGSAYRPLGRGVVLPPGEAAYVQVVARTWDRCSSGRSGRDGEDLLPVRDGSVEVTYEPVTRAGVGLSTVRDRTVDVPLGYAVEVRDGRPCT